MTGSWFIRFSWFRLVSRHTGRKGCQGTAFFYLTPFDNPKCLFENSLLTLANLRYKFDLLKTYFRIVRLNNWYSIILAFLTTNISVMKKVFKQINLTIVVLMFVFVSCEQSVIETEPIATADQELSLKSAKVKTPEISYSIATGIPIDGICGYLPVSDFIAGQNYKAGNVYIANSEEKLYVSIVMNEGWVLGCTHLFIGEFGDIPLNNSGNPQIGKFPFYNCFKKGISSVTFEFNRADFDKSVAIVVHGEVSGVSSETAFAFGTQFPNAERWGWYIDYTAKDCIIVVPPR